MAAKGFVFPHQRLKNLEDIVLQNISSFSDRFLPEWSSLDDIYFNSERVLLMYHDVVTGQHSVESISKKEFKDWCNY